MLAFACVAATFASMAAQGAPQSDAARRLDERLRGLERESAELASREKSLLAELRQLEIEREIKTQELIALDAEMKATEARIADAIANAAKLRDVAEAGRPDVEQRLVRLYKMGRAGYWRLLLNVDDARAIGRTYRFAAAQTHIDRDRIRRHHETLKALEAERSALETRAREFSGMQERAIAARAALDRAVSSRGALLKSIASRQDLTEQLAAELETAQQRLQATVASSRPTGAALPLAPFKGDIPWPSEGIVVAKFGRQRTSDGRVVGRNGIELSVAEGRPVAAVHDGVVSYAAPFTGYAQLVILDHGNGAHTLYGHLSAASVNKGDRVEPGTRIGLTGRNPAGNPALYFELRIDGQPVDPLQWLRRQP